MLPDTINLSITLSTSELPEIFIIEIGKKGSVVEISQAYLLEQFKVRTRTYEREVRFKNKVIASYVANKKLTV